MTRITSRLGLTLLLLVSLVTGCVSFASVKQTATLGEQLSSQENVFDTAPVLCRIERQKEKIADLSMCEQLQQDLENWHKVNRSLVAYAKALDAMADDSKDKSYKDNVSTTLGAASKVGSWSKFLNKSVTDGVSNGVDALIQMITSFYRRDELKQAIESRDPYIQNIKNGFEMQIQLLDEAAKNMQTEASTVLKEEIQKEGAEQAAMRIAYLQWVMAVGIHRTELANYKKAIDAFANAHHDLKENIKKVGSTGDLEVLQLITQNAGKILSSSATAMTPPSN